MKARRPGGNHGLGEVRVETADGIHDAEAVGADEAHLALDGRGDLALERFAGFADFLKAGGNDNGGGNAGVDGFPNDGRERWRPEW